MAELDKNFRKTKKSATGKKLDKVILNPEFKKEDFSKEQIKNVVDDILSEVQASETKRVRVRLKNGKVVWRLVKRNIPDQLDNQEMDEALNVGDHVHLGLGSKGGVGFKGHVTKLDGDDVHIKSSMKNKYGPKTYKGPAKFATKQPLEMKEEIIVEETRKIHIHGILEKGTMGSKDFKKVYHSYDDHFAQLPHPNHIMKQLKSAYAHDIKNGYSIGHAIGSYSNEEAQKENDKQYDSKIGTDAKIKKMLPKTESFKHLVYKIQNAKT